MTVECPECEESFKGIGNHWQRYGSHRPDIPDKSFDIIEGHLLGDGCVSGNRHFILEMTTKKYVSHVASQLPNWLIASVTDKHVETNMGSADVRRLTTRRHPELQLLRNWYGEDGKKYPIDLEITPEKMKAWYCGDGSIRQPDKSYSSISICCTNEMNDWDAVENIFEQIGVTPRYNDKNIYFDHEDSMTLWKYMGDAPIEFKYKWP